MKDQMEIFDEGAKLRDEGIRKAVQHAEKETDDWLNRAVEMFEQFRTQKPFLAEDFREFAHANGLPEPPHLRAWGGVMVSLKKAGKICSVGFEPVKNPKAHKTPATLWLREYE